MTAKDSRTKTGYQTGEQHHQSKLTDDLVRAMRAMHLPYVRGYGHVGKHFHVPVSTVKDVCTYRTWKHVR